MLTNANGSLADDRILHTAHVNGRQRLPGDSGVWIPITLDTMTFLFFFTFFTLERIKDPVVFEQGRQLLHADLGFAMTLVLLTSSWFVVKAVEAARERIPASVRHNLLAAILLAFSFGVLKIMAYSGDIQAGHSITSNQFFGYYFAMTGLHLMHVIVGTVLLTASYFKARSGPVDEKYLVWIESAGCFWHMVDMLWVFLFPMFYLLRTV